MKMIKNLLTTKKNWSFKGKIITQIFVLLLCISHATVGQIDGNRPFITKWDLSIAGSPNVGNPLTTQITFESSGTMPVAVNYSWSTEDLSKTGEGSFSNSANVIIPNLPAGETILLSISPNNFNTFLLQNKADKDRLLDVVQWGDVVWRDMSFTFFGCSNLDITSKDIPKLSNVSSMISTFYFCPKLKGPNNIKEWDTSNVRVMAGMFWGASSFNQPIGNWNTSKVEFMNNMFLGASSFNQSIKDWDITNVNEMSFMFSGATNFNQSLALWANKLNPNVNLSQFLDFSGLSVDNYDALLQALNGSTLSGRNIGAVGLRYCNASAARMNLINAKGWTITGDFSNVPVVSSQPVSSVIISGNNATFSVIASGSGLTYQWQEKIGMGEFMNIPDATNATYTIPTTSLTQNGNQYRVIVSQGTCSATSDAATLTVTPKPFITKWDLSVTGTGTTQITFKSSGTTAGLVNYTWITDDMNMSGSGTFNNTTGLTYITISGLPAGKTILLSIFPTNFSQVELRSNINNGNNPDKDRLLDVLQWGDVAWKSMASSFYSCSNLNITATDTPDLRNVIDMSGMFTFCTKLSGPANINTWNISNVETLAFMFYGTSVFNQPLENWNISKVTNLADMFGVSKYNQPLGNWNTGNVTNMRGLFRGNDVFNQDITNWNTVNVTNMEEMFSFARAFNQAINTWNVTNVVNMKNMFSYATKFNQNLDSWAIGNVINMESMFLIAQNFNQSLAAWANKLNQNASLISFLNNSGLSVDNYDATLQAFNNFAPNGRSMGAVNLRYCNASAARMNLINAKGWTITGDISNVPGKPLIIAPIEKVVCQPNTLMLTASNCAGTVTWSEAGVTGTSLTLTSVGTYSISATCTVNGCTSDESESINGLQIKQKPMPPVIEGTKNVCTPEPITLTATGCLGTITWSDNVTGSTRTFSEMGTYTYTATCTENGCVSEKSLESKSIIFQSPKQPVISPKQSNICEGNSITLVAFCPQMQVLWSNGSTGSVINVSPMTAGKNTYTVTCTAKNGCTSPSSEEAVVFVEAKPIQPIITPSSNTVCSGNGMTLSAGSCDNGNGTLHWTNNQVGNSIYVTPSKTSRYRVACKSIFGCISDSSEVFIPTIIDIPSSPVVESKYISKGTSTNLSATCSTGTPVWYESILGQTSIGIGSLTTSVLQSDMTYYVACETAPNSPSNCSSSRNAQTIFMDIFAILKQPDHILVCSGQNASFSINVSGVSVSYQWQEYLNDDWTNIENSKIYSGTNSSILQLLSPPLDFDGKIYRCIVTNTLIDGTPTQFISDEVGLAVQVSALANNLIMVSPLLGINNIYQAVKTITAFNKILSNSKVSYFAGNSIILNPGFEVKSGNVFQAKVQSTCTNTAFRLPDTLTR